MDFVPWLAALALAWKIVDWTKHWRVRDWNAVVTQGASWAAGIVVVFVFAHSDFSSTHAVAGIEVGKLNTWSLVLLGLSVGSSGSVLYDFKRALDGSDSAAQPSLVTGDVPVVPPPVVDSDTPGASATFVSNVAPSDAVARKSATPTSTRKSRST